MRRIKAAVLGAGWFAAQNHIPVLAGRPEVVLDGVCRLGAGELERVREHFGFAFASEDHREVLARKPDIVVVSTPHHLHYEQTRDALEAGAHVLCEKPMTLDAASAWDLVRRAREAGRELLIANGFQYLPGVDELRRRIGDGLVGEIEHVVSSFISPSRNVFFGDVGQKAWKQAFFRPETSTWQNPETGGGFAFGQLSHSIALMLFLTGLWPKTAAGFSFVKGSVDLAGAGAVTLSNGAVASITGAAAMPEGNPALMRIFIAGARGVVAAEFDRGECVIHTLDAPNQTIRFPDNAWHYNCRGPVDALVDIALGRGRNLSPGTIGAATTATIEAMLASSASGGAPRPVPGVPPEVDR